VEVLMVVNRTGKEIEFLHNSRPYIIPANGKRNMEEDAAWHGYHKCIAHLDPINNTALHLLGVKNMEDHELADCSSIDYVKAKHEELLDRTFIEGKFETKVFGNPDVVGGRADSIGISTPQALRAPDAPPVGGN